MLFRDGVALFQDETFPLRTEIHDSRPRTPSLALGRLAELAAHGVANHRLPVGRRLGRLERGPGRKPVGQPAIGDAARLRQPQVEEVARRDVEQARQRQEVIDPEDPPAREEPIPSPPGQPEGVLHRAHGEPGGGDGALENGAERAELASGHGKREKSTPNRRAGSTLPSEAVKKSAPVPHGPS